MPHANGVKSSKPPYLRPTKKSAQLVVNGEPFLMLAAELHNSSLSNAEYMDTVWPEAQKANINTLLGSVTWEMIEPEEGKFDFRELDKVLQGARRYDMHIVLLWFGSFKNALSTYAPDWVKRDVKRFPRVHTLQAGGQLRTEELVSPFNHRAWEADAKAFSALMKHLKEVDSEHSTVLMVQVENETGLLGDSRDRSKVANDLFNQPVPADVLQHLQRKFKLMHPKFQARFPDINSCEIGAATWKDAFPGDGFAAEEMFMANAYSKYNGFVAAAGKKEYDIPLYCNVWLNFDDPSAMDLSLLSATDLPVVVGGGGKPGIYPSGGPCPHTMDLWKYNAPALDFIGPDLYFHDYEQVCKDYTDKYQPLFIPEQQREEPHARRVWLAIGTYLGIGCSPFGIDTLTAEQNPFTRHYGLMKKMSKHILEAQANRPEDIMGFFYDDFVANKPESPWVRSFGDFELTVERAFVFGKPGPGCGIIIHQGNGKFLLMGWGFQVVFKSTNPKSTFTGILYSEEKIVDEDGNMRTSRIMNGDETRSGAFYIMPNEEPDYGGFPIAVTIPSRTMVAECTAYSIEEDDEDF